MRQGPNGRRGRGRHNHQSGGGNGGGGGNNSNSGNHGGNRPRSPSSLRHQTFDSNGPDVRVRGNAWQVYEKYQALARDAASASDRVAAENYLQHAEHYYRIIEAINEATANEQRARGQQPDAPFYPSQQQQQQQQQPGEGAQPAAANGKAQPEPGNEAQSNDKQQGGGNPFFTPDDAEDEDGGPTQLVARR
ncbi:MAG: DUF4167 domain-containing protein [Alphaproteobacteria bacterium]|nr:DUF4167 domain-containing protein [Alphaproteobacteria bacterium]